MFKRRIPLFLLLFSLSLHADRYNTIEHAGDVMVLFLPATAYAKTAYEGDAQGALQFSLGLSTTLATTFALKYTIDAERPNGENSRSFPSGHSATAFSSATFLQMRYGWEYGLPAYLGAGFVAWSRVYTENHYTRDVVAGAILGVVGSYIFTEKFQTKLTPIADNGIYGLSLSHSFSSY